MRIGIGGGIGPIRGGISNKGFGVGVGPVSAGGSFRGGGSGFWELIATAVIAGFILFWPAMLIFALFAPDGDADRASTGVVVLAWIAEGIYALLAAWWWFFDFKSPNAILKQAAPPSPAVVAAQREELAESYLELADYYTKYLKAWKAIPDEPHHEAQYLDLDEVEVWALRRGGEEIDHLDTGKLEVWGDSIRFRGDERDLELNLTKVESVYSEDDLIVVQMRGRKTFEGFGGLTSYLPLIESSILWVCGDADRTSAKQVMKQTIKDFTSKAEALKPSAPVPRGATAATSGTTTPIGAQCSNGHPMDVRDSKCAECGARLRMQWMEH